MLELIHLAFLEFYKKNYILIDYHHLITFGIIPKFPSTNNGYINISKALETNYGGVRIMRNNGSAIGGYLGIAGSGGPVSYTQLTLPTKA